ncbi:hypothetical protein ACYPKM_02520 [Pseudomonas aeruginosa]
MTHNADKPYYYAAPVRVEQFSSSFPGLLDSDLGYGLHCTESEKLARADLAECNAKELANFGDAERDPTVYVLKPNIKNPLDTKLVRGLTLAESKALIERSPDLIECLMVSYDVQSDGVAKATDQAAQNYAGWDEAELVKFLNKIANDYFDGHAAAFNRAVFDVLGYDSVIAPQHDGSTRLVVWFPENVEIIDRLTIKQSRHQNNTPNP